MSEQRPFDIGLTGDLPDDVAEAFHSMKLAVMRHRLDEWREISQDDMVNALYALQRLALAEQE